MASILLYLTVILIVCLYNINGQTDGYYDRNSGYDRTNDRTNEQRSSTTFDRNNPPPDPRNSFGQYNNENRQPSGQYNNENRGQYSYDHGYGQLPGGSNTDGYYYNTRIRGGVGAGGVGGRFYGNPSDDRERYHISTPFPQPGVLAGWRSDLQGRQRPDSINLERDAYVTTSYGQIQGFKVHLYDNPDPKSYFRPGQTPVERIQGNCSVFLGIPYAMPPIREGRFKVSYLIMSDFNL